MIRQMRYITQMEIKTRNAHKIFAGKLYAIKINYSRRSFVALGGLVVSELATGPKVRRFKPSRGRWILRVIKSAACLPSEGEVEPSVPCHRFTAC
jgi:hypothetical protein